MLTIKEAARDMAEVSETMMSPEGRARSRYIRDATTVEEFEAELDEALPSQGYSAKTTQPKDG